MQVALEFVARPNPADKSTTSERRLLDSLDMIFNFGKMRRCVRAREKIHANVARSFSLFLSPSLSVSACSCVAFDSVKTNFSVMYLRSSKNNTIPVKIIKAPTELGYTTFSARKNISIYIKMRIYYM